MFCERYFLEIKQSVIAIIVVIHVSANLIVFIFLDRHIEEVRRLYICHALNKLLTHIIYCQTAMLNS